MYIRNIGQLLLSLHSQLRNLAHEHKKANKKHHSKSSSVNFKENLLTSEKAA